MIIDYLESQKIAELDPSFMAIIMAAARKADTINLRMLQTCWPEIVEEFKKRYNAPGGALDDADRRFLNRTAMERK
jgi:hypothetical protein